jgi:hypothetical protein
MVPASETPATPVDTFQMSFPLLFPYDVSQELCEIDEYHPPVSVDIQDRLDLWQSLQKQGLDSIILIELGILKLPAGWEATLNEGNCQLLSSD